MKIVLTTVVCIIVSLFLPLGVVKGASDVVGKSEVQLEIERRFPPIEPGTIPEWLSNPVAMEALDPHTVLEPWTPVHATPSQVEVWNRIYEIGAWGLPEQVRIGSNEFLSAPLTFELYLDGNPEPIVPEATLGEAYPGVAYYSAQGTSHNVQVVASTQYEFDGFVRTDIELNAPKNTRASKWEIVVPFQKENAQFFSAIHASSVRMESQQQHSISAAIPEGAGDVWTSDFRPLVWIGNRDSGLMWFSESREHWSPESNPSAIRIVRNGEHVELRIAIIAGPTTLPQNMKLSFGLMATPVKPLPTGWRNWQFATHHSTSEHLRYTEGAVRRTPRGNHMIFWHDAWRIALMYPWPRDPEAFKNEVEFLKDIGVERVYPYVVASHITGREQTHIPGEDFIFVAPEWEAFKDEWEIRPNRSAETYRRVSPATSFADFHLSAIKDWIVEYGVNGVYVDEAYPYPDTVESHGMGFTDSRGIRHPTYQIYSMRDYFKRMAYLFQQYGDGTPAIIAHASGVLTMPFLSFVDVFLTGEQVYYKVRDWSGDTPPSYMDMTPLDQWGAEFSGRQFGYVPLFLPQLRPNLAPGFPNVNAQTKPTREMLALALLHDSIVWPLWSDANEWAKVVFVRDEFDIGGEDVRFFPYWDQEHAAQIDIDDVLVSTYVGDRGVLAVVVNMNDEPKDVTIDFAPLPNGSVCGRCSTAWQAETGEFFNVINGELRVTMPAKDFVLIRIMN